MLLACKRSPLVSEVLAAPGNGGMVSVGRCESVAADDIEHIVDLARREGVGLAIVGPEAPLVAGLTDALARADIPTFGPNAACARLEGSKVFAKEFMRRHGIPTAAWAAFDDADAADAYVRAAKGLLVVKADGLAAGKGVVVANTTEEALSAVDAMMRKRMFGDAGARVVIEERIDGEEVSFHVLTDGLRVLELGAAQDHKRVGDGDRGPNTGGMGAYAPVPLLTDELLEQIRARIVRPTVEGLSDDGLAYRGVVFIGLMVRNGVAHVLEYNVRFGDPECAVLLERLDGDIVPLLHGVATGRMPDVVPPVREGAVIAVVMAANGYPDRPRTGDVIHGLDIPEEEGIQVLHAGTRRDGTRTVTCGGRVLTVTARGATLEEAAERAYGRVASVRFDGAHYRRDIGWRARRLL